MDSETLVREKNKTQLKQCDNACSCYDNECKDVVNPEKCFLGVLACINIGIADGYCPLIHNSN